MQRNNALRANRHTDNELYCSFDSVSPVLKEQCHILETIK